jgi:hypothetical protein
MKDMTHNGSAPFTSHLTYYTVSTTNLVGVRANTSLDSGTTQPSGGNVVRASQPSKSLAVELSKTAPNGKAAEMRFNSRTNYSTKQVVAGLGEKAAFIFDAAGGRPRSTLVALKGDAVIVASLTGIDDANAALQKLTTVALKVLAQP